MNIISKLHGYGSMYYEGNFYLSEEMKGILNQYSDTSILGYNELYTILICFCKARYDIQVMDDKIDELHQVCVDLLSEAILLLHQLIYT